MRLDDDLLKLLERNGWTVMRQRPEQEPWPWYHEIWLLESRWSPYGFQVFLSFLTDQRPGNPNPYWLIATSPTRPEDQAEAHGEPSLLVTPHWIQELPQFVASLDALRQKAAD